MPHWNASQLILSVREAIRQFESHAFFRLNFLAVASNGLGDNISSMPRLLPLTVHQKQRLRVLEPALKSAARVGDYSSAQRITAEIQLLLRPTGHETRLQQDKAWLFEAAMEAGELETAERGFIGVRKKTVAGTRTYLEATALLAICYLRKNRLDLAEPMIAETLKREKNIGSEARRRKFIRAVVKRFEEEGALASLKGYGDEVLDPDDVQSEAGKMIRTLTEDEVFANLGRSLPKKTVAYLLKIDLFARGQLPSAEVRYLPLPEELVKHSELGRTVFSSIRRVLYRSLCDPESDVYKAWYNQGLMAVLDRRYLAIAVTTALSGMSIGVKALGVSATALLIKIGIEVFCDRYKPSGVMEERQKK